MTIEELGKLTQRIANASVAIDNSDNIHDCLEHMREMKNLLQKLFDALDNDEQLLNEYSKRCEED